jgi:hypothetical protein
LVAFPPLQTPGCLSLVGSSSSSSHPNSCWRRPQPVRAGRSQRIGIFFWSLVSKKCSSSATFTNSCFWPLAAGCPRLGLDAQGGHGSLVSAPAGGETQDSIRGSEGEVRPRMRVPGRGRGRAHPVLLLLSCKKALLMKDSTRSCFVRHLYLCYKRYQSFYFPFILKLVFIFVLLGMKPRVLGGKRSVTEPDLQLLLF